MRAILGMFAALALLTPPAAGVPPHPTTEPSFQVDYAFPTADKPQSKLWFADGTWWALLPRSTGPSLWERTPGGWRERPETVEALKGWPGRADVWFGGDGVTAVGVADRQLGVMRLVRTGSTWVAAGLARLNAPASDAFETATIARDGAGRWYIAAAVQEKLYAWSSIDARHWSGPILLAKGLDADDIGLVTPIPGGIAVIWSNQRDDAVFIRTRGDGADAWSAATAIARGGRTADDHLHAALGSDGTLWLATKNSVDTDGKPQLVLRVRSADGVWRNYPYAPRTAGVEPSRPIVVALPGSNGVALGHALYARKDHRLDQIVFGLADVSKAGVMHPTTVIAPDPRLDTRVSDPTGPKAAFPRGAAWIVLASDAAGRVYEADVHGALQSGPQ
ncbi:MAG TPA: hypothetical protein VG871_07460 [Vicinamibacterales bacterium]|nr:hypothetical protein [Vicinamibacterales bacterium]